MDRGPMARKRDSLGRPERSYLPGDHVIERKIVITPAAHDAPSPQDADFALGDLHIERVVDRFVLDLHRRRKLQPLAHQVMGRNPPAPELPAAHHGAGQRRSWRDVTPRWLPVAPPPIIQVHAARRQRDRYLALRRLRRMGRPDHRRGTRSCRHRCCRTRADLLVARSAPAFHVEVVDGADHRPLMVMCRRLSVGSVSKVFSVSRPSAKPGAPEAAPAVDHSSRCLSPQQRTIWSA